MSKNWKYNQIVSEKENVMFTGLIQEQGRISRMVKHQHNIKLTCKASRKLLADYKIGDSMAINGVCLTCVAKAR